MVTATTAADAPPAAISDLTAPIRCIYRTSIKITWTATGEDGTTGTAGRYDLRYSTSPISDMTSFNAATAVTGVPAPQAAGTSEQFTVNGLTAGTTYYFAIVVYDAINQPSGLSNVVTVHHQGPPQGRRRQR